MEKIDASKVYLNDILFNIIFAGSVFITSSKFINETVVPKWYFVKICLTLVVICLIFSKRLLIKPLVTGRSLVGVYVVCVVQALYGLIQYLGVLSSNSCNFTVTGSFDNPSGLAVILAMGLPIGFFLFTEIKKYRILWIVCVIIIVLCVVAIGSRSAYVAMSISFVLYVQKSKLLSRTIEIIKENVILQFLILLLLLFAAYILYKQKENSSNGRLLIWNISSEMIKDKPILGHGCEMFQAKYMSYQAEYFTNNDNSKYILLTDNVRHPFNEYIKIAVEFGLLGLVLIIIAIAFFVSKVGSSRSKYKTIVVCGTFSLFVFSCFSYPMYYVGVWIFLAYYLSILLPEREIQLNLTSTSIWIRSILLLLCVYTGIRMLCMISEETKWKRIAYESLHGRTEEVLPKYMELYTTFLQKKPSFLYNYGAELNIAGRFKESIEILNECKLYCNDYDIQLLLADNFYKTGDTLNSIKTYRFASAMIPCRFFPAYRLFKIYEETGQCDLAKYYANLVIMKKIKVESRAVSLMRAEAKKYLYNTL